MRKIFLTAILALAVAGVAADSYAQGKRATDNDFKACNRDVSKLCRKVMSDGDMAVLSCLQENRAKLTRGCRQVLEQNGQ